MLKLTWARPTTELASPVLDKMLHWHIFVEPAAVQVLRSLSTVSSIIELRRDPSDKTLNTTQSFGMFSARRIPRLRPRGKLSARSLRQRRCGQAGRPRMQKSAVHKCSNSGNDQHRTTIAAIPTRNTELFQQELMRIICTDPQDCWFFDKARS